jgi:hypothetical protein
VASGKDHNVSYENQSIRGFFVKIFMAIFEFIGQFFFQNYGFKLQENFSELGIRAFLENGLGSFHTFFILQV